ncbi:uncharacterized protein EV154DRAFT_529388 [Mucor mucedo]|uniref:uncharacterized protein n=1 Tax=Mucor mucedo TaxID=29922 RepID=UPI00221F25A5|nr:uncharacterized protein EV154DRAFT_529388 [Mucor mucedo]KAI7871976.1 hypothetical protein EV154DRAFT_529388 [Mucor mucedo]
MSNAKIAQEILRHIISYLDDADFGNVLFVCRDWYKASLSAYFRKAFISEETVDVYQPWTHAEFTQELKMTTPHRDCTNFLVEQDFLHMLSRFPRLKKLDLSSSRNYKKYMQVLAERVDANLYLQFIEEIKAVPDNMYLHLYYFAACYNFRHSLRTLELYAIDYATKSDGPKSFTYYLPHFTQLTNLTVTNRYLSDITLFDILLHCDNLTSLNYDNQCPVPLHAKNQLGTTNNVNLKRLTLVIYSDATPYLDYIRSNYCLQSLTLVIGGDIFQWFKDFHSFAGSLLKFKNVTIKKKERYLHDLFPSQTIAFYNFLMSLKGKSDLLFNATFKSCPNDMEDIISICNSQLNFVYHTSHDNPYDFVDTRKIVKSIKFYAATAVFPFALLKYMKSYRDIQKATIIVDNGSIDFTSTAIRLNRFHISDITFYRLRQYSPHVQYMEISGSKYGGRLKKFCFDMRDFKELRVFTFDINQIDTTAEFTFIKLDLCSKSRYFRIFKSGGKYYTQMVSESYVSQLCRYSFTCIFMFSNSSVKIHFRD